MDSSVDLKICNYRKFRFVSFFIEVILISLSVWNFFIDSVEESFSRNLRLRLNYFLVAISSLCQVTKEFLIRLPAIEVQVLAFV